jgi:hypothetical protein
LYYLFYNKDNSIAEVVQTRDGVVNVSTTAICPPVRLKPLVAVNEGAALPVQSIKVDEGSNVLLTPHAGVAGKWQWKGPNNFNSVDSVVLLKNMTHQLAGKYQATFTNSCGTKSYMSCTIEVNYKLPANLLSGKKYTIKQINSGKVLSVAGKGEDNGSNVMLADDKGNASQRFVLTLVDSIYWKITPTSVPERAFDVFGISAEMAPISAYGIIGPGKDSSGRLVKQGMEPISLFRETARNA